MKRCGINGCNLPDLHAGLCTAVMPGQLRYKRHREKNPKTSYCSPHPAEIDPKSGKKRAIRIGCQHQAEIVSLPVSRKDDELLVILEQGEEPLSHTTLLFPKLGSNLNYSETELASEGWEGCFDKGIRSSPVEVVSFSELMKREADAAAWMKTTAEMKGWDVYDE